MGIRRTLHQSILRDWILAVFAKKKNKQPEVTEVPSSSKPECLKVSQKSLSKENADQPERGSLKTQRCYLLIAFLLGGTLSIANARQRRWRSRIQERSGGALRCGS